MHPAGCKTTITTGEGPQTHALGRAVSGIGCVCMYIYIYIYIKVKQSRYKHGVAPRVPEVRFQDFMTMA